MIIDLTKIKKKLFLIKNKKKIDKFFNCKNFKLNKQQEKYFFKNQDKQFMSTRLLGETAIKILRAFYEFENDRYKTIIFIDTTEEIKFETKRKFRAFFDDKNLIRKDIHYTNAKNKNRIYFITKNQRCALRGFLINEKNMIIIEDNKTYFM